MRENKYDDPVFFAKYAQMDRSRLGLKGAGEWQTLEPMLPDFAGRDVLDLGCGSGILGIGALVLGCAYCAGCDVDPKSPDAALENSRLNGINPAIYHMYVGDILADAGLRAELGEGYDIVLANIVSDVIIPLAPYARGFMAPHGVFITSGIIEGRQDEVRAALEKAGFKVIEHESEEGWHMFVCTK